MLAAIDVVPVNVTLAREPKLGIVIPSKNKNDLLFTCVDSIINTTSYQNYKIYIADTGSDAHVLEEINQRYGHLKHIELIKFNYYHFAGINNLVIKHMMDLDTELVLCCNNDIKMLNDAISLMVGTYLSNQVNIGTVGARLHYEDGTLQHLGMCFTGRPHNPLSHFMIRQPFVRNDYSGSVGKVYGNTAAFMLIARALFLDIGGYNEGYEEC
mgnify:FL=1